MHHQGQRHVTYTSRCIAEYQVPSSSIASTAIDISSRPDWDQGGTGVRMGFIFS